MSLGDQLRALTEPVTGTTAPTPVVSRQAASHNPAGWTAGVVMDGATGEVTSRPRTAAPADWSELLTEWGYDPTQFEVLEPVRVSKWEAQTRDGIQVLTAYKARVARRGPGSLDPAELEALCARVRRAKPAKAAPVAGDTSLVVVLADWQIGKADGDGLEGTLTRLYDCVAQVKTRIKELRRVGRPVGHLTVLGVGDLGEGCDGHYAMQGFAVEADRRDQVKISRRLVRDALMEWAPLVDAVTVAAVGGNHGENRRDGKAFTSFGDNDDVAIFEQVAEVLAMRPDLYGHIEWAIPRAELALSVEVAGNVVGIAHGHQARSGDIPKWWTGQALGRTPVAGADLLVTGHFHHLRLQEVTEGRWWLQVPAMDGGSDWWTQTTGQRNPPGVATFTLTPGVGFRDLAILSA